MQAAISYQLESTQRDGFTKGSPTTLGLGATLTNNPNLDRESRPPGYNFAFTAEQILDLQFALDNATRYGRGHRRNPDGTSTWMVRGVIFPVDQCVELEHRFDPERHQTVFWGPDVSPAKISRFEVEQMGESGACLWRIIAADGT